MAGNKKINVALVGMGFGAAFVPIYLKHPDVASLAIVDPDEKQLTRMARQFGIKRCVIDYEEILDDASIDAVHLVTPIPLHARMTINALEAGKHCACTVPAATSVKDLFAIVKAQRRARKNYMMMETAAYTRHFIHVRRMYDKNFFGNIQLLRGCHYQDMENWPRYWDGLPPMWYATHAISPLLGLLGRRAKTVHCFGSGVMRSALTKQYHNPFPAETAIYRLEGHPAVMEITRTLFQTVRQYSEGFCVYGEKAAFEWYQCWEEPWMSCFKGARKGCRGTSVDVKQVVVPDYGHLLPKQIAPLTEPGPFDDTNPQSFKVGGGHHGSHPHLVHEFVRSIIEHRKPWIDAVTAADWTAAGVCAHESAMKNGAEVEVPDYRGG